MPKRQRQAAQTIFNTDNPVRTACASTHEQTYIHTPSNSHTSSSTLVGWPWETTTNSSWLTGIHFISTFTCTRKQADNINSYRCNNHAHMYKNMYLPRPRPTPETTPERPLQAPNTRRQEALKQQQHQRLRRHNCTDKRVLPRLPLRGQHGCTQSFHATDQRLQLSAMGTAFSGTRRIDL